MWHLKGIRGEEGGGQSVIYSGDNNNKSSFSFVHHPNLMKGTYSNYPIEVINLILSGIILGGGGEIVQIVPGEWGFKSSSQMCL